jgi:hypothetical protein
VGKIGDAKKLLDCHKYQQGKSPATTFWRGNSHFAAPGAAIAERRKAVIGRRADVT